MDTRMKWKFQQDITNNGFRIQKIKIQMSGIEWDTMSRSDFYRSAESRCKKANLESSISDFTQHDNSVTIHEGNSG